MKINGNICVAGGFCKKTPFLRPDAGTEFVTVFELFCINFSR